MKNNIGIISQARVSSTRLPNKILKPINGKPLIAYHLDRLLESNIKVFFALADEAGIEPLTELLRQEKISFHLGSTHDVLERFYLCAKRFNLSHIIRVTSDCPLIDGHLIRQAAEQYMKKKSKNIYMSNCIDRTFPRGMDFECFSFEMLEEAFLKAKDLSQREHVTPYFYQNNDHLFTLMHITQSTDQSDLRLTVDTSEDFQLIKTLIENFSAHKLKIQEIEEILMNNPELIKINSSIQQKKL